jgi:hypothetical protein
MVDVSLERSFVEAERRIIGLKHCRHGKNEKRRPQPPFFAGTHHSIW